MNGSQRCFDGLDISADIEKSESFTSFISSYSGSLSSGDFNNSTNSTGYVSGVLSAALAAALTLPAVTQQNSVQPDSSLTASIRDSAGMVVIAARLNTVDNILSAMRADPKPAVTNAEPIDFEWLLIRCEGDRQLVLEVLRSFCEQGQKHLSAMQNIVHGADFKLLMFHAVRTNL